MNHELLAAAVSAQYLDDPAQEALVAATSNAHIHHNLHQLHPTVPSIPVSSPSSASSQAGLSSSASTTTATSSSSMNNPSSAAVPPSPTQTTDIIALITNLVVQFDTVAESLTLAQVAELQSQIFQEMGRMQAEIRDMYATLEAARDGCAQLKREVLAAKHARSSHHITNHGSSNSSSYSDNNSSHMGHLSTRTSAGASAGARNSVNARARVVDEQDIAVQEYAQQQQQDQDQLLEYQYISLDGGNPEQQQQAQDAQQIYTQQQQLAYHQSVAAAAIKQQRVQRSRKQS